MDWREKRKSRLSLENDSTFQQQRATYEGLVIQRTMLRNWSEARLVVRCGVDGRDPVRARRKTASYFGRENPIFGSII